jgi:hypothetical protein
MSKLKIILTLMFLLNCVACSTPKTPNTQTIIQTKTELIKPPSVFLADPQKPLVKNVVTTRDLIENSDAFELAYLKAVEQLRILREWYKAQEVKNDK